MPRARPQPPLTLEQRLAADLAMTGGKMPIDVIVADEEERGQALRILAGKRHARLLRIVTAAEREARRKARRLEAGTAG
jgi:hypothetical protein